MQLILKIAGTFLFLFPAWTAFTQQTENATEEVVKAKAEENLLDFKSKKLKAAEINILFSYYEQDGNNSPVTGGIGTEQLADYTPKIIINVPIGDKHKISMDAGFDYYTSASTDNIDQFVSSASRHDVRVHGNVGYTRLNESEGISYGLKIGGSNEYDYSSLQFGGHFAKTSKDGNRELALSAQALIDQWELIYPQELRGEGALVPTNQRRSYNLGMSYSQVLNKRLQASLTLEGTLQSGLLSTPFHRVYFQEQDRPKVERLPNSRLKIPLGLRLNYYANDRFLLRLYYRYYWDDWGLSAHTFSVEVPLKVNRFFSVYPFYRYHTQSGVDFFKPYKQHTLDQVYYTSDYDLSTLNSHHIGLGIRYSPAGGIARVKLPLVKNRALQFKGIDLRYGHYIRSTGLNSNIISLGLNFTF